MSRSIRTSTFSLAVRTFVNVSTSPWKPAHPRTVPSVLKKKKKIYSSISSLMNESQVKCTAIYLTIKKKFRVVFLKYM